MNQFFIRLKDLIVKNYIFKSYQTSTIKKSQLKRKFNRPKNLESLDQPCIRRKPAQRRSVKKLTNSRQQCENLKKFENESVYNQLFK